MLSPNEVTTVYLSGPMDGIEERNRAAFDRAARELKGAGFEVISPWSPAAGDSTPDNRKAREFLLSRDIDFIQEAADAVVVLAGWENSPGARLEVLVAQCIGVPVFSYSSLSLMRKRVVTSVEAAGISSRN